MRLMDISRMPNWWAAIGHSEMNETEEILKITAFIFLQQLLEINP